MAGPGGETCGTCYFFDQIADGPEGYCRHENADSWVEARGDASRRLWPRVDANKDWSGDWRDRQNPLTGILATGGAVLPAGATSFAIPGGSVWTHFNPGTMVQSSIVQNVTLASDTLTWNIPGTFPVETVFVADFAIFGSVTYPSAGVDLRWTLGDETNTPFSADVYQRVDITNQVDDIALPFGFAGGPAISSQTGNVRVLAQSPSAETVTVNTLYFQIRIVAFNTA